MSRKTNEISDDEIRIISANEPKRRNAWRRRSLWLWLLVIAGIIAAIGLFMVSGRDGGGGETEVGMAAEPTELPAKEEPCRKGFVTALDTVVNSRELLILRPENARPRLTVGTESLSDSSIVLAAQAADVRRDNGRIAGAFVLNGELISKGEAKAGYCAIINGELSIGVADASPMLEQALTESGFFFRQYPLVVGGQIVENKPGGAALRKALAEIGGRICVVVSKGKLTFHDFSQLLIDAGARNAIYLVGASSFGFYVNDSGERISLGQLPATSDENVSFIVWE